MKQAARSSTGSHVQEVSKAQKGALQSPLHRPLFPELTDLIDRLRLSTNDGRIWLDDQRMLLMHARALGSLRREMIDLLGLDVTRGLFTRMGYQAGYFDAQMARKVRSNTSLKDMFVVGPQLHCIEGIGLSEPVKLEFDIEKGIHYGEFVWTHQVEDEEHTRHFSIGTEPSCWMQVGYACGFSSEFMGRQILYREVECSSMGQKGCRIIGKPAEEWGEEGLNDLKFLMPAALSVHPPLEVLTSTAHSVVPSEGSPEQDQPVGISPGFNSVLHMVARVAPTNATVLFLGESGVGKEVFARTLHRLSDRANKPFVAVNCAAIPEQLIESELFGTERGAFTGATHSRAGRFERADGGTLFLDEIGTLTLAAQGNLLRALQEGEIERLGDTHTRRVDVRVIAATNVDLREEVQAKRFREDLFFRLNVFPIRVVPLRERREDIPLLLSHFLAKFNRRHGRRLTGFTQRAVDAVLSYDWPGNIRELENAVERGVILATEGTVVDAPQLFTSGEHFNLNNYAMDRSGNWVKTDPQSLLNDPVADSETMRVSKHLSNLLQGVEDTDNTVSLDDVETLLLRKALDRAQGNIAAAARLLGITRPQMVYRLKSRGISQ
jgi:two-component system, NtrC family, response regulator HydG